MFIVISRFALRDPHDLITESLGVSFHVHRDEGIKLKQTGIDFASHALMLEADLLDHHLLELAHVHAVAEIGNFGRLGFGVDRPADQGQRPRLSLGVLFGKVGSRRQRQRCRLAHGNDMDVRPKMAHVFDKMQRVIFNVELPRADGNVAGVVPVGDVKIGIRYQADDRGS